MNAYSSPSRLPSGVFRPVALFIARVAVGAGCVIGVVAAEISSSAWVQIQALQEEKASRSPVEQKIDSQFVLERKRARNPVLLNATPALRPAVKYERDRRILVDIDALVTPALLREIERRGGTVVNSFAHFHAIRALLPLDAMEDVAASKDVRFIRPAAKPLTNIGTVNSQGDVTHGANTARSAFQVDGTGVNVGVLSDSVDYLASSQANGNLGPVTVLAGQSGVPGSGEGTAMLEIIHDLAPGAQLFYATAVNSPASFAQNILDLRAAGCHIIVDDVGWSDESPFQDGVIAEAVNTVTADGAYYFSAAANSGNKDDNTSGTWEGDFLDGGAAPAPVDGRGGRIHSFGPSTQNTLNQVGQYVVLFWSDPLGASSNDYDLYVLNSAGTHVVQSSSNIQNGSQDPAEEIDQQLSAGQKVVIVKASGAARYLHLDTARGRLSISTGGNTKGHSAAADAFSVAAVNSATSYPNPFSGGASNPVESFSSDGPRRVFYEADGTPITPGNFSSSGGTVRQKPDLAAADGVTTSVPGFGSFFGTSAAAPHAAAVAALLLSYNPTLTTAQVRSLLTSTALDIEAAGVDPDSGAGIVMALPALQAAPVPVIPAPVLAAEPAITPGTQNTISWQAVSLQSVGAGEPTGANPPEAQIGTDVGQPNAAGASPSPILNAAAPNLTPYQPAGWSDKIVVSKTTGTSTDSTGLTTADTLYVDWAVLNNGTAATGAQFTTELYVDGVLRQGWISPPPLDVNFYGYVTDYSLGTVTAGSHTIRIKADSTGAIAESNESDNEYTKTISVSAVGVIEYYAECADNSNFTSPLNSGWIQQLQYTFSSLTPGQSYSYRVKARRGALESQWSNVETSQQQPPIVVRTLTVNSATPDNGVLIGVSPNDNNQAGGGTTPLARVYNQGSVVTLTAPDTAGGNSFQKWQRDAVDYSFSTITPVTMDADHTLTAVYVSGPADTAYVTGKTLGSLRNNYTGFVGMKLAVGANPLLVSALGRIVVSGNSGTHLVKLVKATDGSDVPGGSVSVATSGGVAGQFKYATLGSPVTLDANTTYYLMSQETQGGDSWYYYDTTVTTTSVATELSGVYGPGGTTWSSLGTAGHAYGPVDFKYSVAAPPADTAYVTGKTLGSLRNNYTGFVGMKLSVGANQLTVTALGRIVVSGNSGTHLVKLVKASDGNDVPGGSVSVATSGGTAGQFKYATLGSPVTLDANTTYYLVTQETLGGDSWYYFDTTVTTTSVATELSGVFGPGGTSWSSLGTTGHTYGPVDFKYSAAAPPVVRTLTVNSATPDTGVLIGVSPNDNNQAGGGTTPLARVYNQGSVVTLTAPDTAGGNSFQKWQRDAVDYSFSTITPVTMDADHTLTAVYVSGPADTAYVTGKTLGSLRNNYTGFVGMKLAVGANPLLVSALGRIVVSGNSGTHLVKLVKATDGSDVPGGSVSVATSGGVAGQFKYATLSSPVTLDANTTYYLMSQETLGGDSWYYFDTTVTTTSVATELSGVYGPGGTTWSSLGTAGHAYGPVDFKYSVAAPPADTAYVTGKTLGSLRNNYTGFVGMKLSVGANQLTVTALGRIVVSGNSGTHLVKLVKASDGNDVPGGSVSVATSGGTAGQFKYATLGSPVTLDANTTYYLVTQETLGGDSWYYFDTTVTTTSVAGELSGVFGPGGTSWSSLGTAGHTYGPVDFKYSAGGPSALAQSHAEAPVEGWVNLVIKEPSSGEREIILQLTGQSGQRVALETTSDFSRWVPVSILVISNQSFDLPNTDTPASSQQFYRLVPVADPTAN